MEIKENVEFHDGVLITFPTHNSHSFIQIVENTTFKISIVYCPYNDSYVMNVDKLVDGEYIQIINGIALTTGVNLFQPFKYHKLGNMWLFPLTDKSFDKNPSAETLVSDYVILWEHD